MTEAWNIQPAPMDGHNQRLLDQVHPQDWTNPKPEGVYNLVVIGAGTAGLISAIGTAGLGGKVALIERHLMGGDCLNVGCVPSKALIAAADESMDFSVAMERVRKVRADISINDSAARYTEKGVDVYLGEGRFTSKKTIEVEGRELRFKKAVICTGARAYVPEIPGLAEAGALTNETIFNLTERPEHLVVLGGGPIGCELAQAFRRLGARVTIIERDRFLPREDPAASAVLAAAFEREGIEVVLDSQVERVSVADGSKKIHIAQNGQATTIEGDHILVGMGRAPNVADLGLEAAGVEFDVRQGVKVNDRLRTTQSRIYAAGDCCMQWKFTHAADIAAQIVIQNALFGGRKKLSTVTMPWCTYTDPEIAHVGLYEHEAKKRGMATTAFQFDLAENDRSIAEGETAGFVKIIVKKGTDEILGATIVAAYAGEMINEVSVAMVAEMGLGKLGSVIHPYPTRSEAIKRVAGLYNQTRLTPTVARLLKGWLKFQRR